MPKVNSLIDSARASIFNLKSARLEAQKNFQNNMRLGISCLMALAVCVFVVSISTPALAQESVPEFKRRRGLIQKFGSKSDLVTFETDGQKLKPDFDRDRNSNQVKLQSI